MLFSQLSFLVFFAIVLAGNWLTGRSWRANNLFLLLVSWVFFAYWSLTDFVIFLAILVVNYPLVQAVDRLTHERSRRWLAALALAVSLGTLGIFKYGGFLSANLEQLLGLAGIEWHAPRTSFAIPLAISFYTFHIISLVLDILDRKYPAPSFFNYALYISFFPHIIAGPIVRGNEILPDVEKHPRQRKTDLTRGFYNFVLGYFFKVVVGDQIADVINPYWSADPFSMLSVGDAWCVAMMYSCQIFADFAGYSWMAIGLAKALGFDFPENFRAPYLAASFRDFWHRWHVTLSRFLSDYLYIKALGGSRCGPLRASFNLMLTMLLGGLWHGPAWNYIVWGGVHGGSLACERMLGMTGQTTRSFPIRALWFCVVQFTVLVAWVFFRSPDVEFAAAFFGRMVNPAGGLATTTPTLALALILTIPVWLHHVCQALPALQRLENAAPVRGLLTGALTYAVVAMPHVPQGFIYFVF
jgi:alginate O-acetyltransferase complex protein AlgI